MRMLMFSPVTAHVEQMDGLSTLSQLTALDLSRNPLGPACCLAYRQRPRSDGKGAQWLPLFPQLQILSLEEAGLTVMGKLRLDGMRGGCFHSYYILSCSVVVYIGRRPGLIPGLGRLGSVFCLQGARQQEHCIADCQSHRGKR